MRHTVSHCPNSLPQQRKASGRLIGALYGETNGFGAGFGGTIFVEV